MNTPTEETPPIAPPRAIDSTSPESAPPMWRVLAAFAAIYLIWGSTYLAIRFGIETIPPFLMAGSRFVVAGGLLYAFARVRGAAAPALRAWGGGGGAGGPLLALRHRGGYWG